MYRVRGTCTVQIREKKKNCQLIDKSISYILHILGFKIMNNQIEIVYS